MILTIPSGVRNHPSSPYQVKIRKYYVSKSTPRLIFGDDTKSVVEWRMPRCRLSSFIQLSLWSRNHRHILEPCMAISMHRKDPDPPKDKGWIQGKTRFWIQLNIKIQIKGLVFKRTEVVVNRWQPPAPAPVLSLSRNLQQLSHYFRHWPNVTILTPWVFWV